MTQVCFITNHGVAGDQAFEWLPRALCANPDVFVYLGESVRAKYFKERGRGERPDPLDFEGFLKDVAGSYELAIEAYSYRAFRLQSVKFNDPRTRFVNIVRDPLIWLHYFRHWRVINLNQPAGVTTAIDHEWSVLNHGDLAAAGLNYSRDQVHVWAFLRGIQILNLMVSDKHLSCETVRIEDLYTSFSNFADFLERQSNGKICAVHEVDYDRSKSFRNCRAHGGNKPMVNQNHLAQKYTCGERYALEHYWAPASKDFFTELGYSVDLG
mgnify:CR=1 FL=1